MLIGQLYTGCYRVHIVLCFSLLTTNAGRHRMLTLRQEIPDFSVDKDVKGRASCDYMSEEDVLG